MPHSIFAILKMNAVEVLRPGERDTNGWSKGNIINRLFLLYKILLSTQTSLYMQNGSDLSLCHQGDINISTSKHYEESVKGTVKDFLLRLVCVFRG